MLDFERPLGFSPALFPQRPYSPLMRIVGQRPQLAGRLDALSDVLFAQESHRSRRKGREGQCALTGATKTSSIIQVWHRWQLALEMVVTTDWVALRVWVRVQADVELTS